MPLPRFSNSVLMMITLAALGALLVVIPPQFLVQYERVKQFGAPWTYIYFGIVGAGASILAGLTITILWKLWSATREKHARQVRTARNPSELSNAERQVEVAENLDSVKNLQSDGHVSDEVRRELQAISGRIEQKQAVERLEIVAFGTVSSGKSSLLNALAGRDVFQADPRGGTTIQRQEIPWPGGEKVLLVDTPGLGEIDGAEHVAIAADAARDADLVLMVVDGPLRQSEFRLLEKLGEMEKRVLVCLNKSDWYDRADQEKLRNQIGGQIKEFVSPDDIAIVRSQAAARQRVRVLPDGRETEETVTLPADIGSLAERMIDIVQRDGRDLLLANLLLQSRGLVDEARKRVRDSLDRRALEIVERFTWGAGAAAALSPLPILDLFAGSAITAKMVVDLAKVYRQPLDLDAAVTLLAQLGKNLVAILGVNLAAPAVASGIAAVLKTTVPFAGQIAGGALQGIVQALVTRWIGAVFIQYFQGEMQQPEGGLANLARREWQKLTSPAELWKFVQTAKSRLIDGEKS